MVGRETKNNLPKLVIIFYLIKANFSKNNGLFKRNLTQSKRNRMTKSGRLFFISRLILTTQIIYIPAFLKYNLKSSPFNAVVISRVVSVKLSI